MGRVIVDFSARIMIDADTPDQAEVRIRALLREAIDGKSGKNWHSSWGDFVRLFAHKAPKSATAIENRMHPTNDR